MCTLDRDQQWVLVNKATKIWFHKRQGQVPPASDGQFACLERSSPYEHMASMVAAHTCSKYESGKTGKTIQLQAWSGPEGSRNLRFPDFMTTAQDVGRVVNLTHRPPLSPGNTPDTHFCQRLSRPQSHNATGRIMSLKNSNEAIGNRTRDLPVCSVVS